MRNIAHQNDQNILSRNIVWPESGAPTNNNALGIIIFFIYITTVSQLQLSITTILSLTNPLIIISRPTFSDTIALRKRVASRKVQENLLRTRESIEVNSVYLTPIMWNTKLKRKEEKKS